MSEVENCPVCYAIFRKISHDICPTCLREEEKKYQTVRGFIRQRKNRTATLSDVVSETGVEEILIIRWIQQKRLITTHMENLGYPCECCESTIQRDRLCRDCKTDLTRPVDERRDLSIADRKRAQRDKESREHTYYTVQFEQKKRPTFK